MAAFLEENELFVPEDEDDDDDDDDWKKNPLNFFLNFKKIWPLYNYHTLTPVMLLVHTQYDVLYLHYEQRFL